MVEGTSRVRPSRSFGDGAKTNARAVVDGGSIGGVSRGKVSFGKAIRVGGRGELGAGFTSVRRAFRGARRGVRRSRHGASRAFERVTQRVRQTLGSDMRGNRRR